MIDYKELTLKFDEFIDSITQEEIDDWFIMDQERLLKNSINTNTTVLIGFQKIMIGFSDSSDINSIISEKSSNEYAHAA
jgi:hypothetical protein